jgi:hypothetical protein
VSIPVRRMILSSARNSIRSRRGGQCDFRTTAAFVLCNSSPCPCSDGCSSGSNIGNSNAAHTRQVRSYFTNGDRVKREDPYAVLGLQWGDGATTSEIKAAYKKKAAQLHPDVNREDKNSHEKFQDLQKAYQTIMKLSENINAAENIDEWRWAIWNKGDRIAVDRTDVAGVAKKRPVQPASTKISPGLLGHPDGRGTVQRRSSRAEYLGDGSSNDGGTTTRVASSVGTGLNKWVTPKAFVPWNGGSGSTAATAAGGQTVNKGRATTPPGSRKE